ncbi:MAG: hypothetical protein WCY77_10120 [Weeksellaceae bacterium]
MVIAKLIKNDIDFIVVQYYSYLTYGKFVQNESWEIIVPQSQRKLLKGESFGNSELAGVKMKSRELRVHEIAEFKELRPTHFTTVVKDSTGAVYERVGKNFKTNILKINQHAILQTN